MPSVEVIPTAELDQSHAQLQRRTDLPATETVQDELRASRGILLAVALGLSLWGLIFLGIYLLLH